MKSAFWSAITVHAMLAAGMLTPSATEAKPAVRRTLNVSLYPFIPDANTAYTAIKERFERLHPEIALHIDVNPKYYKEGANCGQNILHVREDVYEVDSVFLDDFAGSSVDTCTDSSGARVRPRRLKPLPADLGAEVATSVPLARNVVERGGRRLGLPHWLCGNFLIYRKSASGYSRVASLGAVEATTHAQKSLPAHVVVDLIGTLTLGEMYLDAAMDRYGAKDAALSHIDNEDPALLADLRRVLTLEPVGFGRNQAYHDQDGFYERQFAAGKAAAFVGYSESTHAILSPNAACPDAAGNPKPCLSASELAVADWPQDDAGSHQLGWVDSFVLDGEMSRQKTRDAAAFIRFMNAPSTYRLLLIPRGGDVPRYLLPARADILRDRRVLAQAPLYPLFYAHIRKATVVSGPGLNGRLSRISTTIGNDLGAQ